MSKQWPHSAWDLDEAELTGKAKAGDTSARDALVALRRERLRSTLPPMTWDDEEALVIKASADPVARDQLIDAHLKHIKELLRQRTLPSEGLRAEALDIALQAIRENFVDYDVNWAKYRPA